MKSQASLLIIAKNTFSILLAVIMVSCLPFPEGKKEVSFDDDLLEDDDAFPINFEIMGMSRTPTGTIDGGNQSSLVEIGIGIPSPLIFNFIYPRILSDATREDYACTSGVGHHISQYKTADMPHDTLSYGYNKYKYEDCLFFTDADNSQFYDGKLESLAAISGANGFHVSDLGNLRAANVHLYEEYKIEYEIDSVLSESSVHGTFLSYLPNATGAKTKLVADFIFSDTEDLGAGTFRLTVLDALLFDGSVANYNDITDGNWQIKDFSDNELDFLVTDVNNATVRLNGVFIGDYSLD